MSDLAIYVGLFTITSFILYYLSKYYFLYQSCKDLKKGLDAQFKILEELCDKDQKSKLMNINNSVHQIINQYTNNIVSYKDFRNKMKSVTDEIFELMDTFYYR